MEFLGGLLRGVGSVVLTAGKVVVGVFLLWFLLSVVGFGISSADAFGRVLSYMLRGGGWALTFGLGAAVTGCYLIGDRIGRAVRYIRRTARDSDSGFEAFVIISSRSIVGIPLAVFSIAARTLLWPLALSGIIGHRLMARNDERRAEIREYWELKREIESEGGNSRGEVMTE